MRVSLPLLFVLLAAGGAGCDSGVDFAAAVDGHSFVRAGALLTKTAQVVVDFTEAGTVTLTAEVKDGEVVTDSADASCDRGEPEQGLFETRLPADNCEFVFEVTSTPDDLPESPTELVIGFRNLDEDGSVELDPSLEEDLPSPFSFADSYSRLRRLD